MKLLILEIINLFRTRAELKYVDESSALFIRIYCIIRINSMEWVKEAIVFLSALVVLFIAAGVLFLRVHLGIPVFDVPSSMDTIDSDTYKHSRFDEMFLKDIIDSQRPVEASYI